MAPSGREDGEDRRRPVVMVTGCSEGGIGHALARAFAAAGCAVVATARSRTSMRGLEDCLLLELDVRSDDSVRAAVADTMREHGRLDVLVNNAGVHLVAPLAEVPMESFHQVFDTNVYGTILKFLPFAWCDFIVQFIFFFDNCDIPDEDKILYP